MSDFEQMGWRPDDDPRLSHDELDAELSHVVSRGRRHRARRRAAIGSTLAVASIVTVVAAAVSLQSPDDARIDMAHTPTTTTVEDTTTSSSWVPPITGVTTSVPPGMPPPSRVVVVRPSGTAEAWQEEIAVLDAKTKKLQRTIYRTEGDIHGVTLSSNEQYVYFVEENCGNGPVQRVRVDGPADQKPEVITRLPSGDPAVTRDGRNVAYIGMQGCDPPEVATIEWSVRVHDFADNSDRRIAGEAKGYLLSEPSWSPDGATVAVSVQRTDGPTLLEAFVVLLDATKDQDILTAPRLKSRTGFGYTSPTFLLDGSLFVIEKPLGNQSGTAASRMVVVDRHSGDVVRLVATGDPKKAYHRTDADRTGQHLLYISSNDHNDPGELRVSSNGGRTTVLVEGVTEGNW